MTYDYTLRLCNFVLNRSRSTGKECARAATGSDSARCSWGIVPATGLGRWVACRLCPCLDKVTPTCNTRGCTCNQTTPAPYCCFVFFPEGTYFMSSSHVPADPASVSSLSNQDLDSTLRENRVFPPPAEFSASAHIKSLEEYEALYKESIEDPEKFWAGSPKNCTGSSRGTRCWSGICRGPNGLSAARST